MESNRSWNSVSVQSGICLLSEDIHKWAYGKGFWPEHRHDRNFGEMMALIHTEIAEATEAHRKGIGPDEHCPEFSNVTIELADAVIRIFDVAAGLGLPLPEAIAAKMNFNETRPVKHGKKY